MRAHKSRCPSCGRAFSPKRPCLHAFDRPTLRIPFSTGFVCRPIKGLSSPRRAVAVSAEAK